MQMRGISSSPVRLLLAATLGTASLSATAGETPADILVLVAPATYQTMARNAALRLAKSDCRRYRVVWSGGVARRGPDRIRPRPVRSRWRESGQSGIFCNEGDSFDGYRVANELWIR